MDDVDFATERAESFNAAAIQMALHRPHAPLSNGICQSCDADIETDRIQANPHARLCHDCAEEQEEERRKAARRGPR